MTMITELNQSQANGVTYAATHILRRIKARAALGDGITQAQADHAWYMAGASLVAVVHGEFSGMYWESDPAGLVLDALKRKHGVIKILSTIDNAPKYQEPEL